MDLNSIFSILEKISKDIENKDGERKSITDKFDKDIGIDKEHHDKVVSLIETFTDSGESIRQYGKQINKCTETIDELNNAIRDLEGELSKTKKKSERARKQSEIDEKKEDRNRTKDRKDRLEDSQEKERRRRNKSRKQLRKYGVTNVIEAKKAAADMDNGLISMAKGGGMAKALSSLKGNPWMMAFDGIIKAVEFAFSKSADYVRLNAENTLRAIAATTTVSLNDMKASLDSWQDAVNGAYSAQQMAISSQAAMLQAQNATELANLKMTHTWTNWIPILGQVNAYNEVALEMEQKLAEARLDAASKIIAQVNEFTKKTDDYIKRQDKAVHLFQAETGMSSGQTKAFEDRMFGLGERLAKMNRTIEDALKMQSSVAAQSGRVVNYSNEDYVNSLAVGRVVGDENLEAFQAQMQLFNHSVSGSADIMYEMYRDANKMGISQRKLTKDVLANLKLASKYDFKNGTKGFIELAKWAENARFNLSSLDGTIDKVLSGGIEGVIEQSARLQVLGGNFAANADPMGMFYEALNDPAAYAKRMHSMVKGMGRVDRTTGETTFGGEELLLIRQAAQTLGMSPEDLMNPVREENKKGVVKKQMKGSSLSDKQMDAVANKAQRDEETGKWYVNMVGGGKLDVNKVQAADLDKILSDNKEDNAEKYAQSTLSVVEQIEATAKQIDAKLGLLTFDNFKDMSKKEMEETLSAYTKYSKSVEDAIKQNRSDAFSQQKVLFESLKGINNEYRQSQTVVETGGEAYSKDHGEDLRIKYRKGDITPDGIDELKANPKYRKGMSVNELKALRKKDTRTWYNKFWDVHRDSGWVAGDEGDEATDYRTPKQRNRKKGIEQSYQRAFATPYHSPSGMYDGIASGNGQPMAVSAASITPIQDGAVKIAKSDPNDSAIFAKSGGPFDKLFNGVFDKINALYDYYVGTSNGGSSQVFNRRGGDSFLSLLQNSYSTSNGGSSQVFNRRGGDSFLSLLQNSYSTSNGGSSQVFNRQLRNTYTTLIGNPVKGNVEPLPFRPKFEPVEPRESPGASREEIVRIIKEYESASPASANGLRPTPVDVHVHGDISLKANGESFDISRLIENDPMFVRKITELIITQIDSNKFGGRPTNTFFPNRFSGT